MGFSAKFALAFVPALVPLLAAGLRAWLGDFDSDPNYVYLFNGLNLLFFAAPGHIDHPGTPVQMLCGALIAVTWLARSTWLAIGLTPDVLRHPESYLWSLDISFAALLGGSIYFLGSRLFAATSRLPVALVAQASFLVSIPVVSASLPFVAPEMILLTLGALIAGLLAPALVRPDAKLEPSPVVLGMLIGIAIASKVTAAPLLLAIFYLPLPRDWFHAVGAAIASAIAATLPIAPYYSALATWFMNLLTHSGYYGAGDLGLPSAHQLATNLAGSAQQVADLYISLAAALIAAFLCRRRTATPARLFIISAVILALQIVTVMKHPGPRYYVPAVPIAALVNAGIVHLILSHQIVWQRAAIAAFSSCLAAVALNSAAWTGADFARHANEGRADLKLLAQAGKQDGCLVIVYYRAPDPRLKLAFADGYARYRYAEMLANLYPGFVQYDTNRQIFDDFTGAAADLSAKNCVRLVGDPLEHLAWMIEHQGMRPRRIAFAGHVTLKARTARLALYNLDRPLHIQSPGANGTLGPP